MPVMAPIRRARAKLWIEDPPSKTSARSMKIMVSELLMERAMVSVMALLAIEKRLPEVLLFSSRIRSKTTIES